MIELKKKTIQKGTFEFSQNSKYFHKATHCLKWLIVYFCLFQNENLITQILSIMAHPRKFFEYKPGDAKNQLPEFYAFVEKKVTDFLRIPPSRRRR